MDIKNGASFDVRSLTVRSDTVKVTPPVATRWLATQVRNRRVQRASMLGYRRDMEAVPTRWHFAADPIRFDVDGHLIDGQNRLEALAGITDPHFTVDFLVVRGLDSESQMYMDQGARRTSGQQLSLKGFANGTNLAAGVRQMWAWERGKLFEGSYGARTYTTPEVVQWIEDNSALADAAGARLTQVRNIGLGARIGVGFVLRLGLDHHDLVTEFYTEMSEMINLAPGSPTRAFVKRIARTRQEHERHLSDLDMLGFLIKAWNVWIFNAEQVNQFKHKALTKLQRPHPTWTAANFPELVWPKTDKEA